VITKYMLSNGEVEAVMAAAKAEAAKHNWAVSIAVVDDGGFPQGLLRLDRASPSTALTAQAKARTAALSMRETKSFHEAINGGKPAMMTLPTLEGMLEGGVPLLHEGRVVCAVGVSGVKAEEDAQVARAGLAAIKL
jgi:glc operon protein GlcG